MPNWILNCFSFDPKAASMYFWSVSWSTNCLVYFSFFLVDQKKIVQSQRPDKKILVSLWIFFGQSLIFLFTLYACETGQFCFGRSKKKRNRPDNWSTKRLTKSTWTPLLSPNNLVPKLFGPSKIPQNNFLAGTKFFRGANFLGTNFLGIKKVRSTNDIGNHFGCSHSLPSGGFEVDEC